MRHSSAKDFVKVENLGTKADGGELTHIQVMAYYHKPEYYDGKEQGFYLSVTPVQRYTVSGCPMVSWSSERHPFNKLFLIKKAQRDNKRYTEKLVQDFMEEFRKDPTVECMNRMVERFWAAA